MKPLLAGLASIGLFVLVHLAFDTPSRAQFTPPALPNTYTDVATPAINPPSGTTRVYTKGGQVCALNPSGTETCTAAAGSTGAMTQISQTILGASAASITFSGIAGTFTNLEIELMGRGDTAANSANVSMQVNGDTNPDYHAEFVLGANGGVSSGNTNAMATPTFCFISAGTSPTSVPGECKITIFNYSKTTFFKDAFSFGGVRSQATANNNLTVWWQWVSTSAITSVTLAPTAGNFIPGTIATLYGIT